MRRSLSPGAALTSFRTAMDLDVSDVLAAVRVPTLVMPRPANPGPGQFTAERIRGAELVELPPLRGLYTWVDDDVHQATMAATARFVVACDQRRTPPSGSSRRCCSPTSSARRNSRRGSAMPAWRDLIGRHHAIVRRELARYHGRELDTAGDGFFAVSMARPEPSRLPPRSAINSARSASTFERACIPGSSRWATARSSGSACRFGARISALAGPGEVLVSSTVKDLVAGSGLRFEDRGEHVLKGIGEPWRVLALRT